MKQKELIIKGFNVLKHDLEFYLEEHPLHKLNTRIYNKFVEKGGTSFDIAEIFDEAYFIATKAYHDKYPANNFYAKFNFCDENNFCDWDDKSKYMATWYVAYFIILDSNESLRTGYKEDFLNCFWNSWIYKASSDYKDWESDVDMLKGCRTIEELSPTDEEAKELEWVSYDFELSPISPYDVEDWKTITNNFDQEYIKYIVNSYDTLDYASESLNRIRLAWRYDEQHKDDLSF